MTLRAATVLTSPVRSVCLVVGSLIRSQSIIAFSMSNELTHATCEVQPTICTPAKVACCSFYNSILVWLQGEASGEGLSRPLSRDDGMLHRLLAFPCSRLWDLYPCWPMSAPAPTLVACREATLGFQCVRHHSQVRAEGYSCSFGCSGSRVHMARQATTIFAMPMFDIRNSIICILGPC